MLSSVRSKRADARPASSPAVPSVGELEHTPLYSEELGIDLAGHGDVDCFLWFLASLLFGARISEKTAKNTFLTFVRHGLTSPSKIIDAGWDFLVNPIMREGGYVRYDGRKSTQILRDCQSLIDDYRGSLENLHEMAKDARDLEARVNAIYGVGPVTTNIFLRELRPYWQKADPAPLPVVVELAQKLGLDLARFRRKSLSFARLEAGLLRNKRLFLGPRGGKSPTP